MPEEDTFDRISRILATPMPRRQAMKLITGLVASGALGLLGHQAQAEAKVKQNKQILPGDIPVHNFVASNKDVVTVIRMLRTQFQVPISFIQSITDIGKSEQVTINIVNGTVKDVLTQLTKQNKGYLWETYEGRIAVYPNEVKYQQVITPSLAKGTRSEVTSEFISYIKTHTVGFGKLVGLVIVGNYSSRLFDTPITLPLSGTVSHLFLELLGSDPDVMFSILPEVNGFFSIGFNLSTDFRPISTPNGKISVSESKSNDTNSLLALKSFGASAVTAASAPTTCRPLLINYGTYQPDPLCNTPTPDQPCPTCPSDYCGTIKCFRVNSYTACPGDDCSGLSETETIINDKGCSNQDATQGGGCVASGSNFNCCTDTYAVCTPPQLHPKGCVQTFSQKLSMNNVLVQRNILTFTVPISNGVCGTPVFSNSTTATHQSTQCCGSNPPAFGAGSKTLCDSPQICINKDVCCDPGTLDTCLHVCCAPETASYPGDKCITDSQSPFTRHCCPVGTPYSCNGTCCKPGQGCVTDKVTGNLICCPSGTSVGCNGACCPAGNTCTNGNCCPAGQATSDNKLCCGAGQSPYGPICCTTGQNNCNNTCCANTCCNGVCCDPGQTCAGGLCCGQPTPQNRMSAEAVSRGSYATDDMSICCAPGYPPCGNVCCASGSICCGGSCCAGSCDSTGVCIPPPGENK